ncbi:MAG: carboxypeptidase regulatory-like domain-containing protein, partial [Bacteroidales bacterium]|nr:carboxypeptidase regulatory-like domain-containing protein [Bacteroidales bacterium]
SMRAKASLPLPGVNTMPRPLGVDFYYDEELAYWVEEGIATKEGNKYTGNVSHFSFWKLGKKAKETATVNGKVIDRNGRPIVGQNVRIDQVSAVTDNNGYFEAKVLPDHEFLVGMNYKGFEIKMDAGPIAAGQTQTIDLSVPPMTYVVGTIADCDNNPKRGQANLSWGEPEFSNLYTKNGNFELSIPSAVKNSTLTLTVGKFSVKQKVENADKKAEINVGTIVVCDTSQINTELEDTDKNKEEKKPVKVDKPKIEGRYNFTGRSDNQSLVNYHYIELSANGKYIEKYQPKNSPNYVGGTEGTWKVSGDKLILTTASGSVADTYTIKGNKLIYESGGIIFTFSK